MRIYLREYDQYHVARFPLYHEKTKRKNKVESPVWVNDSKIIIIINT